MEWFKIKSSHVLWDDMSDRELAGWVRLMALTAHIEKMPSHKQMRSICTENVLKMLSKRFENVGKTLSECLQKELDDVQKVIQERERLKAYRSQKHAERTSTQTSTERVRVDKSRVDKSRVDITTSSGYEFYINNINLMPGQYESEKVIDIINQYTDEWFINACKVAIQNNARKINYIEAILKKSKEKGTGVTESKKQSYEERRAHAEKMEREAGL